MPPVKLDRSAVLGAAERIAGHVRRTPLLRTTIHGTPVWLKAECLQTGGAFKLRGASNRLLQLSPEERRRGVVAFSSGNHAQGVAIAAKRLGIPAAIVMPADAPALKVEGTRAQGPEIVFYDRATEDRVELATRLAAERGATLVPSFDDPDIVAGQGTVGLEISEQLEAAGEPSPSVIVVPCGGGGLASGIALACPDTQIICAEPEGWDDMRRSLDAGKIIPVGPNPPPTLCDALQTPRVSPITFEVLRRRHAQVVTVSDDDVETAMLWAFEEHGLTIEPGGAAALAAVLAGHASTSAGAVIVLSGGNVDPALHAGIVNDGL